MQIIQVADQKTINISRFRVLLNDGEYSHSFAMLATQVKL